MLTIIVLERKEVEDYQSVFFLNPMMIFNNNQQEALDKIKRFLESNDSCFLLAGYSGTGKTTLAKEISTFKKPIFLTPTNAALKRLREKIENDKLTFSTIHSYLFQPKEDEKGLKFRGVSGLLPSLYIIDECSMIDKFILEYLLNNKASKTKIIFLGDNFQLPPVGDNPEIFKWDKSNYSHHFKEHNKHILTEVVRYDGEILRIATEIRTKQSLNFSYIKSEDFVIKSKFSSHIATCVNNFENFIIICATNKQRLFYNNGIRKFKYKELAKEPINEGETLISISNNTNFVNGDSYYVGSFSIISDFQFRLKTELVRAVLIQHNGILTFLLPEIEQASFSLMYFAKNPMLLTQELRDMLLIYNNKYQSYNVNNNVVVATYGYATSCHKSQGNEWDYVFVDSSQMFFKQDNPKWFYTAITRAKKKVEVICPGWMNIKLKT